MLNNRIYGNEITITGRANGAAYNNTSYGIWLFGEKLSKKDGTIPKGDWRVSNVSVTNNKITLKCTGYAIQMTGAVKNTVSGNTVICDIKNAGKGGTGDGIRMEKSTSNTISGNTITNKRKSGKGAHMSGICLMNGSDGNKITNNTISNASVDGIRVSNSNKITITGNKISKAGHYGINASKSQVKKASKNKITGCKTMKL